MIHCNNNTCKFCKRDYMGNLICTGSPYLLSTNDSLMGYIIICGTYCERNDSQVPELHPGRGQDGLFPGQLRGGTV